MDEMTIEQKLDLIKAANELREKYQETTNVLTGMFHKGPVETLSFRRQGPEHIHMSVPQFLEKDLTAAIMAFLENKMSEQLEELKCFRIELVRG